MPCGCFSATRFTAAARAQLYLKKDLPSRWSNWRPSRIRFRSHKSKTGSLAARKMRAQLPAPAANELLCASGNENAAVWARGLAKRLHARARFLARHLWHRPPGNAWPRAIRIRQEKIRRRECRASLAPTSRRSARDLSENNLYEPANYFNHGRKRRFGPGNRAGRFWPSRRTISSGWACIASANARMNWRRQIRTAAGL